MTVLALLLATTLPATASGPASTAAPELREELASDIAVLEQKLVALAEAMDESQYDWTPMEGVRTVRQVFMHVASSNYLFPTLTGTKIPSSVPIHANFDNLGDFENATRSKSEVVRALRDSFEHLKAALDQAGDLDRSIDFFGRPATARRAWLETITHAHEHLGQAIAYARANHVVPPWSK